MNPSHLDECFKNAIGLEQMLHNYYLHLADDFASEEGLRTFYLDLALDEKEHTRALIEARKGEPKSEQLEAKAGELHQRLVALQSQFKSLMTAPYGDFNVAYVITHDLEKSEVNHVFLMLVSGVMGEEDANSTFRSAMDEHLKKVVDLDQLYPAEKRVKIRVTSRGQA